MEETLQSLSNVGVPAWILSFSALLLVLNVVGILKPFVEVIKTYADSLRGELEKKAEAARKEKQTEAEQDRQEQLRLWQQMIELQSGMVKERGVMLDYITNVQGLQHTELVTNLNEGLNRLSSQTTKLAHQIAEQRTSLHILVQDASRWSEERETILKIPILLADLQQQIIELMKNGRHT